MIDDTQYAAKMAQEVATYSKRVQETNPKAFVAQHVLDVMATIPRHVFAPELSIDAAYDNAPQQIGYGQTISQPYIVGLMTTLLEPKPKQKILEIGTGSGYQAAVLAKMGAQVYSIEVIPELSAKARNKFAQLDITNIITVNSNGINGWPEHAPYDSIIVTAASRAIPQILIDQLKISGKLVIPIENEIGEQELMLIEKQSGSKIDQNSILPVRFVPFQTK